jgi:hypothetical protein
MPDRDVERIHVRLDEVKDELSEIRERLSVLETYRCVAEERHGDKRWIRQAVIQAGLAVATGLAVGLVLLVFQ